jgi:hypothetical protein
VTLGPPQPGWPPYGYPQPTPYPNQKPRGNGFAIASIVIGVVGCLAAVLGFGVFAVPITIIGLVLGIVASSDAKKGRGTGRRMAIAGIVLCGLALVLTLVWVGFLLTALIEGGEIP